MAGIITLVHKSEHPDGPFYTISEVAKRLGKSRDTARTWAERCGLPEYQMPLGEGNGAFVWLYSEQNIKTMEDYGSTVRVGRPPKKKEQEN